MKPFIADEFEGTRQYDRDLVDLLQEGTRISSEELIRQLDVQPSQTEVMQGIDAQLEQLEAYGLISGNANGWRWNE